MVDYVENASDKNIKYSGCIARHKILGVLILDSFIDSENFEDPVKVKYHRLNGTAKIISFNSDFDVRRVELGCRNYLNQCLYIGYSLKGHENNSSVCYRQGVSVQSLTLFDPLASLRYYNKETALTKRMHSLRFLKDVFKEIKTPEDTSMITKVLNKERYGGAINKNYMVSLRLENEEPAIYRKSRLIGLVNQNNGDVIIPREYEVFSDELIELGINTRVVDYVHV